MRLISLIILSGALFSSPVFAADPRTGRVLYETHCGTCHYERLHKREKTSIRSFAALRLEVARWALQTGRSFTPAELDDIAEYLNQSHYRIAQ